MADANPFASAFAASDSGSNPFAQAFGSQAETKQPAATPARKPFETPKNVRANPLRETGELLALPLSLAGAAWESIPALNTSPTHKPDNYLGKAIEKLRSGHGLQDFYNNAAAVNEEYDPFSNATMERAGLDPKAHPVLRGVGELAGQWYSPGNAALGRTAELGLGLGGKALRNARSASPVLDDAIRPLEAVGADIARPFQRASAAVKRTATNAAIGAAKKLPGSVGAGLRGLVDRYYAAGLPQRGGAPYVQAAFAAQAAPEHAAAQATNAIRKEFDGLTLAQKREIQKLSYVDENGQRFAQRDSSVPEPKKGPTLEERAANIRGMLFDLDRRQAELGIRTNEARELYNSGSFFPMRQFGEQPVFESQDLANAAKAASNGDQLALTNALAKRAGRRRSAFSAGVSKPGHKAERELPDILNPDVEAELHPEYDPAYQLEKHVGETERAIANEQARRGLETLPNINPETGVQRTANIPGLGEVPLTARMPLTYSLEPNANRPLAMIFGQGEAGKKAMERYITRTAGARAADLARQDPTVVRIAQENGVDPRFLGTRTVTNANLGRISGRLSEATKAKNASGKLARDIGGGTPSFQTAKGSSYTINPNGTTTRFKAVDNTNHPASERTVYVDSKTAHAMVTHADSHNISFPDGITRRGDFEFGNDGKLYAVQRDKATGNELRRQVVSHSTTPSIGSTPVEFWNNGRSVHVGHEITSMSPGKGGVVQRTKANVAQALEPLAEPATAKTASRAYNAAASGLDKVSSKAAGLSDKSAERVQKLNDDFQQRAGKAETAAAFQKAARNYYGHVYEEVAQNIRNEAPKAPEGYTKESTLGLGSPTGRDMALDDSFANFFKGSEKLSPREVDEAKALWRAFQVMNRLARMSVVLIPTVHGLNNLGIHYLAEGGEPVRMAEILSGRAKFSDALKQRAYKAGAATDWSQQAFAINDAHATTAIPERAKMIAQKAGPFSKVVEPAANVGLRAELVYNRMNNWLFHEAEQGYAFDLFDRFTKQGMSDGEAAMKVRNALGRYDNLSPRETAMNLNKVFYFYPWMKTAIGYWTKKGIIDPRWWEAPERGIQVNNEAQGYDDPSRPFTATLGKRSDGEFRRYTVPLPQRVTENIAEAARVPLDLAQGQLANAGADAKAPFNYVVGHANPGLQFIKDLYDLVSQGEQKLAPWNTFKVKPGETGLPAIMDVGSKALGKVISPIGRSESILQDPIGGIAAYLTGGSTYGTKTQSEAAAERSIRESAGVMFHDAIQGATNRGNTEELNRLNSLKEAAIQRAIQNLQRRQSGLTPLPLATP